MRIFLFIACFMSGLQLWCQEPSFLSLKQAENLAIQNNYQLNASLHRLEQGYYGYQASRAYFLPSVAISASVDIAKEKHTLDGALKLSQPLYDKVACYQLKEAHIEWEQLRLEVQQQICEILFQVREAYYEIVLNQAHLIVDKMSLQIWQDELKREERQLELGASIPYEVNQTQLHLKNASRDFYATQQEMRASEIKLLTLLGLFPETSLNLKEKDIPLPPLNWQKREIKQWKKWAFQYRPELKQKQFALRLSQNQIQQTKAETYPTVGLYANAGHRYINAGFDDQPYIGVGVNIDWTLYHPSYRLRIKQAQEASREAASRYEQTKLETAAEIHRLIYELEQLYHSYLIAQEGAILAEEGMQMATKKHQLGVMSDFEYRDTIKTWHEAQQSVNQAKFDLHLTYSRLVQQTGIDLRD